MNSLPVIAVQGPGKSDRAPPHLLHLLKHNALFSFNWLL